MSCACRCHVNPGAGCDAVHDTGSSGVPGVHSCSPCDGGRPAAAASRRRTRAGRAESAAADERQVEVTDLSEELLALWRVMPAALARDSAGLLTGDRHSKGAAKGSPATVNVAVMDAAALIETGLYDVAAQAVRMLKLKRDILGSPERIIAALPDWYRSLAGRGQPLASHIRSDLDRWVKQAGAAIGTRRHHEPLGQLCPHHRTTEPTPLRVDGSVAVLAPTLVAGPVHGSRPLLLMPACQNLECGHGTCEWVRDRRLVDRHGRPTDWVLGVEGELQWRSVTGDAPFTWRHEKTIRCPFCKASWSSVGEKRMLALMLKQLGDQVDVAALTA